MKSEVSPAVIQKGDAHCDRRTRTVRFAPILTTQVINPPPSHTRDLLHPKSILKKKLPSLRWGERQSQLDIASLNNEPPEVTGNLSLLENFTERGILQTLRNRFESGIIYTFATDLVLIAINPRGRIRNSYESGGEQSYDVPCTNYWETLRGTPLRDIACCTQLSAVSQLQPYLYFAAQRALNLCVKKGENQSIVVTGESGSGKTETTKFVLQYIASLQRDAADTKQVELAINGCFLIEALGSVETCRNRNASRFLRSIKLVIGSSTLNVVGASIQSFLLEESNVVSCHLRANPFRIFRLLLNGGAHCLSEEFFESLAIEQSDRRNRRCPSDFKDDVAEFRDVLHCLRTLNLSNSELEDFLKTLAAILHIGNIEFQVEQEVKVVSWRSLSVASRLLGLKSSNLELQLKRPNAFGRAGTSARNAYEALANAVENRNILAKVLYSRIFAWAILKVNKSLAVCGERNRLCVSDAPYVGLLEMPGFESLQGNFFEQECTKFVDEKLWRQLVDTVTSKQDWCTKRCGDREPVEFVANADAIQRFDSESDGVFSMLDSSSGAPSATGTNVLEFLSSQRSGKSGVVKPVSIESHRAKHFMIVHHAEPVDYRARDFIHRNSYCPSIEATSLLSTSTNNLVRVLFPSTSQTKSLASAEGFSAVSGCAGTSDWDERVRFHGVVSRMKLKNLLSSLDKCAKSYVRCIRPNATISDSTFDSAEILRQLWSSGTMELMRAENIRFAASTTFKDFCRRFHPVSVTFVRRSLPDDFIRSLSSKEESLLLLMHVTNSSKSLAKMHRDATLWKMTATKVFVKRELLDLLEAHANVYREAAATCITRSWHRFIARRTFLKIVAAVRVIQCVARGFLVRRDLKNKIISACKIQRLVRSVISRKRLRRSLLWVKSAAAARATNRHKFQQACVALRSDEPSTNIPVDFMSPTVDRALSPAASTELSWVFSEDDNEHENVRYSSPQGGALMHHPLTKSAELDLLMLDCDTLERQKSCLTLALNDAEADRDALLNNIQLQRDTLYEKETLISAGLQNLNVKVMRMERALQRIGLAEQSQVLQFTESPSGMQLHALWHSVLIKHYQATSSLLEATLSFSTHLYPTISANQRHMNSVKEMEHSQFPRAVKNYANESRLRNEAFDDLREADNTDSWRAVTIAPEYIMEDGLDVGTWWMESLFSQQLRCYSSRIWSRNLQETNMKEALLAERRRSDTLLMAVQQMQKVLLNQRRTIEEVEEFNRRSDYEVTRYSRQVQMMYIDMQHLLNDNIRLAENARPRPCEGSGGAAVHALPCHNSPYGEKTHG